MLTYAIGRGLPANVVYVADGARPIDASAVGAAVGRLNGLMLLRPGADLASAEARLAALGITAPVDRLVRATGTGGSDPTVPVTPPPPPPPPGAPPPPPPPVGLPRVPGCPPSSTARNLILLTNGSETRNGTALADLIVAGSGNDVVNGLAGNDCIDLGPGNDRGTGSTGSDFLQGGLGNDRLQGSSGNDSLRGDKGNDRLEGSTGKDSLSGGSGSDTLLGGSGNDSLNGGAGADKISGSSGNDKISARDGRRDRITCGKGRDSVTADTEDRVSRDCERVRRA